MIKNAEARRLESTNNVDFTEAFSPRESQPNPLNSSRKEDLASSVVMDSIENIDIKKVLTRTARNRTSTDNNLLSSTSSQTYASLLAAGRNRVDMMQSMQVGNPPVKKPRVARQPLKLKRFRHISESND